MIQTPGVINHGIVTLIFLLLNILATNFNFLITTFPFTTYDNETKGEAVCFAFKQKQISPFFSQIQTCRAALISSSFLWCK